MKCHVRQGTLLFTFRVVALGFSYALKGRQVISQYKTPVSGPGPMSYNPCLSSRDHTHLQSLLFLNLYKILVSLTGADVSLVTPARFTLLVFHFIYYFLSLSGNRGG